MGRGMAFRHSEDDFLITNTITRTADELLGLHELLRKDMLWPKRTKKSLARRIERLRSDSRIGLRDGMARRKAYYGRHKQE